MLEEGKMDHHRSRYPFCIVWTPIPLLTWLFPFIGHMGICMSSGVIRDFAGPYFVSEDNMGFGKPTKFWKLDVSKVSGGAAAWDRAIILASEEYKGRMVKCGKYQDGGDCMKMRPGDSTCASLSWNGPFNWRAGGMLDQESASDSSSSLTYSGSSSSCSSGRNYLDPWDAENAMYVRGKRISFASDPDTFSSATAAVECEPLPKLAGRWECGCEPLYNSAAAPLLKTQQRYLGATFCTVCDAADDALDASRSKQAAKISPPASLIYKVPTSAAIDMNSCSCDECSSASCSPVIPPPPLMLFSSTAGLRLLHESSECVDCLDPLVSFRPAARRFSVPAQPKLAYMYDAPRARAKRSLPSPMHHNTPSFYQPHVDANNNWRQNTRRLSLALPPTEKLTPTLVTQCDCVRYQQDHDTLLAPPRHPCRWGMARSGHVAIDYTNAWMSLARRIKPSRG